MYAPAPRRRCRRGNGPGGVGLERRDLAGEDRAARRVLVAQIDIDIVDADCPRGDQRAFEEAMRVALEVVAILERSRLAFVDVDRHQARRRLGTNDLPLAPHRETRAAEAAQRRRLELGDHRVDGPRAVEAAAPRRVAAAGAVLRVVDVGRARVGSTSPLGDRALDHRHRRRVDRVAPDDSRRRVLAAADARRADHANAVAAARFKLGAQRIATGHPARQRLAHAHGDRWRRRLAFLHHVEVVVERRDLVDLGQRELHLLRQRDDVRRRDVTAGVLDPVQVLDQEIAPPGRIAQQRPHFRERPRIDGAALRLPARPPLARQRGNVDRRALVHPGPDAVIRGNRSISRRAPRGRASAAGPASRRVRCRGARAPR